MTNPAWNKNSDKEFSKESAEEKDAYSELKRLLLNDEQALLHELQDHVLNKKQRTEDVADVLSESIKIASQDTERLSASMSGVIHNAIQKLIKKDPKSFADALFPVMGPAIRKSLNETLKSFMQSLNYVLELNTSPQGLKWRWEAWRKGVKYSDFVLKKTLVYRVDEAFLIQPSSGLLISHVAHSNVELSDSDAVSAMLSAIQDFIQDSFSVDKSSGLETVELGEQTLWVVAGPQAILACAIRGIAPPELRIEFQKVLEDIHGQYEDKLAEFEGDRDTVGGIPDLLATCLNDQHSDFRSEEKATESKPFLSLPLTILLSVLGLGLLWFVWSNMRFAERLEQLQIELNNQQGIVVYKVDTEDKPYTIHLLQDPLANDISVLPTKYDFDEDDIKIATKPFQSVDNEILLKRAQEILKPSETVAFSSENNHLLISGKAPIKWIERTQQTSPALLGYKQIDVSKLTPDYSEIIQQARKVLQVPNAIDVNFDGKELELKGSAPIEWLISQQTKSFSIPNISNINLSAVVPDEENLRQWAKQTLHIPDSAQFEIINKEIVFSGIAPLQWVNALDDKIKDNAWLTYYDVSKLKFAEETELEEIKTNMEKIQIFFTEGRKLAPDAEVNIVEMSNKAKRALSLAKVLGKKLRIALTGYTDGIGNESRNISLRKKRALLVKQKIVEQGLKEEFIIINSGSVSQEVALNPLLRRVDNKLLIEAIK